MVVETIPKEKSIIEEPKFRDPKDLPPESLTDPDYRIKQIAKMAGIPEWEMMVCSRCHHCR